MAEKGIATGRIDLLFSPGINLWNGKKLLQLIVKDLRWAEESSC